MDDKTYNFWGIVLSVWVVLMFVAAFVARQFTHAIYGDGRLPAAIFLSGFGVIWLVNLWLGVRYDALHWIRFVGWVDRASRPIAYWVIVAINAAFGLGLLIVSAYILMR